MAADCKSADESLRWFESSPVHHSLVEILAFIAGSPCEAVPAQWSSANASDILDLLAAREVNAGPNT